MRTGLVPTELVEQREILPGHWLQSYHAPDVARSARSGQYVHVRAGDLSGLLMRRPWPINTADPATGTISVHIRVMARADAWFAQLRPGDRVDMVGPLGRPFEVDPRARHVLLIAGGYGISRLRLLADEALRAGRQVALLFGAVSAADVYPSTLLPDEVEYVVATEDGSLGERGLVTDLIPEYEAWADQAFASGPQAMLTEVARVVAGRRARMGVATLGRKRGGGRQEPAGSPLARRKAFLQVGLEQTMGCAAGTCLGCVVRGGGGAPQRVCREGPAFAADEIDWEAAS